MLKVIIFFAFLLFAGLWAASILNARNIEIQFPPIGEFAEVRGARMHYVDTGHETGNGLPAIVFVHGASGNLRDAMAVYRERLESDYRLIFIDRPGHGYSEAFEGSNDPKRQAASLAGLLDHLDVESAVLVGHSFGGVVIGAFGVLHAEKTAGLVFLAPVSHPWGTGVDWHYDVGNLPVIGWLFSRIVTPVADRFVYRKAVRNVFRPNAMPEDYSEVSGTRLVLRPDNFLENARDVARVAAHVAEFHPRYREIDAPTVIFHGDQDDIVSLSIHSVNGLSKDIPDARLYVLEGVGHKPDYVAANQIEAEIRRIGELSNP